MMAEVDESDEKLEVEEAVLPVSQITFRTHSFDSRCLKALRENKVCCPECYDAVEDKSKPEKFDFFVNPDGLRQHYRIQHKNLQLTKDCSIKAKNVSRLVVSSETIRNIQCLSSLREQNQGNLYTKMKVSCVKTKNDDLVGTEETVYAKSESEAAKLIALYLYHHGELVSVDRRDEAVELLVKSATKEINKRNIDVFFLTATHCENSLFSQND